MHASRGQNAPTKPSSAKSWVLIGTAITTHGLFVASLFLGWLDPLFNDATHRLPRGLDFYAVYQKSHEFSEGRSLYAPVDYRHLVVPHCAPYFRYLPTWAWLMAHTLCRLEPEPAYWVWVAFCESLLLVCLALFLARARSLEDRAWQIVIWLCFTPYYLEMFVGQFTFAAAALLALACLALDRGRQAVGALGLTLSVCVKQVGLLLVPPLVLLGRRRVGLAALAAPALLSASYFVTHPKELPLFLRASAYGTPNRLHAGNLGLVALLQEGLRAAGLDPLGSLGASLSALLPLAVVVWLVWLTWRFRATDNVVPLLLLWIAGYFLIGPDVYEHHWVLLLPVLAWARLARPSLPLALIYVWLALPTPFALVDVGGLPRQEFFEVENLWWSAGQHGRILLYHAWKIAPTVALLPYLVGGLHRRVGAEPENSA